MSLAIFNDPFASLESLFHVYIFWFTKSWYLTETARLRSLRIYLQERYSPAHKKLSSTTAHEDDHVASTPRNHGI